MLYKLKEYGITGDDLQVGPEFSVGPKNHSEGGISSLSQWQPISRGTPQGSIISPTLFNILINDFSRTVGEIDSGIVVSQFADDSSKWLSGPSVPFLQKRAQRGLDQISEWCTNWGFKISSGKTVGILFWRFRTGYKKTVKSQTRRHTCEI